MWPFRKRYPQDVGVLGEQIAALTERLDRLEEDYSAFKETQTAFRKRMGMRYARGAGGDDSLLLEELKRLRAQAGSNGGTRSQFDKDFGEL